MEEHDNHHFTVFQHEAEVTDWFKWHKRLSVEKKARNLQFTQILAQQIEKLSKWHTELWAKLYFVLLCTSTHNRGKNWLKKIWKFSPDNSQNKEQLFGLQRYDVSQISLVCRRIKTSYNISAHLNTNYFSYVRMKALNWSQTVCLWTSVPDWSIHWNAFWETR